MIGIVHMCVIKIDFLKVFLMTSTNSFTFELRCMHTNACIEIRVVCIQDAHKDITSIFFTKKIFQLMYIFDI